MSVSGNSAVSSVDDDDDDEGPPPPRPDDGQSPVATAMMQQPPEKRRRTARDRDYAAYPRRYDEQPRGGGRARSVSSLPRIPYHRGRAAPPVLLQDLRQIKRLTDPQHTMIDLYYRGDKIHWECLWCGSEFRGKNPTKILLHLARARSSNIAACTGPILAVYEQWYEELYERYRQNQLRRQQKTEQLDPQAKMEQLDPQVVAAAMEGVAEATVGKTDRSEQLAALQPPMNISNNIGPQGADAIAEFLATNSRLTKLYINNNNLGPQGVAKIAQALKTNVSLQELHMQNNGMGVEGVQVLMEALQHNNTLTTLAL
jgi:Leucine Rich repeat